MCIVSISRWLTEAVEEQAQDKRPLKVKLASWFWTVWDENLGCLYCLSVSKDPILTHRVSFDRLLLLLLPGDPVRGAGVLAGGGAAGLAGAALALDQAQLETGDQDRRGVKRKKISQVVN